MLTCILFPYYKSQKHCMWPSKGITREGDPNDFSSTY